jgi:hypothetical protein
MDQALRERRLELPAMTGSSHDGEVINAARAANKLLKQHKISTWSGQLTDRQEPVFAKIMLKVRRLRGETP